MYNKQMDKSKKYRGFDRNVVVTGLVSFFMDFSSEMIYPLVPLFLANVLGVNKSVIGLIEGIAEATASLLRVFSGWISDRIGSRKWLMAAGYGIATLSRPIIALAAGWHHVLAARFVDRFGKGIRVAPRDALIAESSDRSHIGRAFGLQRAMDTFGAVVGPATAFLLLGLLSGSYRTVFWISMIPGLVAVGLVVFMIKEKKKGTSAHTETLDPGRGRFDWRFRFFVIIAAVFALGNSSDVFLILRAQQLGISSLMIPVVYLVFNLVYSLSSFPAGVMADRFGRKRVILLGFLLFAAVYSGFARASSPGHIWLLFCLYGLFMGLTEGIQKAFLATIIPAGAKATAYGIYNTVAGFAILPASLVGGWLWDHVSPSATFYFGMITALVSAALFGLFILITRRSMPGPSGT
jgi:MFS family permease